MQYVGISWWVTQAVPLVHLLGKGQEGKWKPNKIQIYIGSL